MDLRLLLFIIITGIHLNLPAQENTMSGQRISLLFMGDIMGHDSQIWSAQDLASNSYDYEDVFSYIKPVIAEADFAVANLEVTLAGPPYKGYPQFSSPAALAVACKNAGIDCLITANNHSADRGKQGITGTIARLDSIGIHHTGTFTDPVSKEKLHPLMLSRNGLSIALLNYTYGTNGLKVPAPAIVNTLDRNVIAADIAKAKSQKPDLTVLLLHWGTEYDTLPSVSQTEMAEYFFSLGVDLIIGSHPHVLQKMVWYNGSSSFKGKAVAYSLGNFISNQRKPRTDGGSMVKLELIKRDDTIEILSAGYYLTWVYTPILNYRQEFYILPCSEFENKPAFFGKKADFDQMLTFIKESRSMLYRQNEGFREYIYNGSIWLLNN